MKTWSRGIAVFAMASVCGIPLAHADESLPPVESAKFHAPNLVLSPVAGWNRNELSVPTPMGEMVMKDTSPEYGIFALGMVGKVVINDFFFWTKVNDTDVLGNLFHANYYQDVKAPVSWMAGAGYLYHKLDSAHNTTDVNVPIVKAGPTFTVKDLHLMLNPYVGYMWERISTTHGDTDNNSLMYGITVGWHWRMLDAYLKYYYQDSQGDVRGRDIEGFNTVNFRFNVGITHNLGLMIRYDYMEHYSTTDKSILIGPTFVF